MQRKKTTQKHSTWHLHLKVIPTDTRRRTKPPRAINQTANLMRSRCRNVNLTTKIQHQHLSDHELQPERVLGRGLDERTRFTQSAEHARDAMILISKEINQDSCVGHSIDQVQQSMKDTRHPPHLEGKTTATHRGLLPQGPGPNNSQETRQQAMYQRLV